MIERFLNKLDNIHIGLAGSILLLMMIVFFIAFLGSVKFQLGKETIMISGVTLAGYCYFIGRITIKKEGVSK